MKQQDDNEWYYVEELKGESYHKFLNFALSYSDYFSLSAFKSVREKQLNPSYRDLSEKVSPYEIDAYNFKRMPQHYERGQKIHVYTLNEYIRKVILNTNVERMCSWMISFLLEYLSFFCMKIWFLQAKVSKLYKDDEQVPEAISQITCLTAF